MGFMDDMAKDMKAREAREVISDELIDDMMLVVNELMEVNQIPNAQLLDEMGGDRLKNAMAAVGASIMFTIGLVGGERGREMVERATGLQHPATGKHDKKPKAKKPVEVDWS